MTNATGPPTSSTNSRGQKCERYTVCDIGYGVRSDVTIPAGQSDLTVRFERTGRTGSVELRVDGNRPGLDQAIHRRHHQVHIDGRSNAMVAQRLTHHRADGQVRHIVVVHDVEMDDIGACIEDINTLRPQVREVRGEDGRCDEIWLSCHDKPRKLLIWLDRNGRISIQGEHFTG